VIESARWNGTGLTPRWDDSRFDGQCLTTWYSNRGQQDAGSTFVRTDETLTSFGYTIGVPIGIGSISMTSKSGASVKVGFDYSFGNNLSVYWLCGNTDKPAFSLRIFAGS
jgi:hypothetical protein